MDENLKKMAFDLQEMVRDVVCVCVCATVTGRLLTNLMVAGERDQCHSRKVQPALCDRAGGGGFEEGRREQACGSGWCIIRCCSGTGRCPCEKGVRAGRACGVERLGIVCCYIN